MDVELEKEASHELIEEQLHGHLRELGKAEVEMRMNVEVMRER